MNDRYNNVDLAQVQRIHVMGVCGSGMGTFAGMLRTRGFEVRGSDAGCYPPMSDLLADWGIPVMEGYHPDNLAWQPDLVVVGNVIRRTNIEAEAMRELNIPHISFPEALSQWFLNEKHSIVISGTHGKTTTTSLTAWLLHSGGTDPSYLVGGVPLNFGKSYRLGTGPHFVVEGDEYDTAYFDKVPKFLHYQPQTAVITNIEFDHADIYPTVEAIESEFRKMVRLIPPTGRLIVCGDNRRAMDVATAAQCTVQTYGTEDSFWSARDIQQNTNGTQFVLYRDGQAIGPFQAPLFGRHNIQNTVAALAIGLDEGMDPSQALKGLQSFQNVKKRHEIKGIARGVTVIDDFAHHPTAVRETVRAVSTRYPDSRLWCCFEVESNTSRRRVFQQAYIDAFSGAHCVVFCKPLAKKDNLAASERLDLESLVQDIQNQGTEAQLIPEVQDIVSWLTDRLRPGDVVLGMSGRHFYGLHDLLLKRLNETQTSV